MSIVIDEVIADVQGTAPSTVPPDTPDLPPPQGAPAATLAELIALQHLLHEREARLACD